MKLYSPGVEVVEIDLSQLAPGAKSWVAVYVGNFEKGPIGSYTYVDTVEDFIFQYGKPTDANYNDWYQIYNFLQYKSGKIAIARVGGIDTYTQTEEYTLIPLANAIVDANQMLPLSSLGGNYVLPSPDIWVGLGDYTIPAYSKTTLGIT